MQRLQVAEPRSLSDSNRYLMFFLLFFSSRISLSFSDSSSSCCPQEPRSPSIYETCSIGLRKTKNRAAVGNCVALAIAPQKNFFNFSGSSSIVFRKQPPHNLQATSRSLVPCFRLTSRLFRRSGSLSPEILQLWSFGNSFLFQCFSKQLSPTKSVAIQVYTVVCFF